jgi:hypothetical protein
MENVTLVDMSIILNNKENIPKTVKKLRAFMLIGLSSKSLNALLNRPTLLLVTFIFEGLIQRMSYRDCTFANRLITNCFQIRHN